MSSISMSQCLTVYTLASRHHVASGHAPHLEASNLRLSGAPPGPRTYRHPQLRSDIKGVARRCMYSRPSCILFYMPDPSSGPHRRLDRIHFPSSLSSPISENDSVAPSAMSAGVDAAAGSGLPIEVHRLPTYIDRVANALQLSIQYRAELHAFKELVLDLPPGFWRVSIYQQASIYRSIQLSEELREDVASVKSDVKVVSSQLSRQFVLSVEQRDEILSLCKALVIDSVRYDYNFADEALAKMKNAEAFPLFAEVFRSKSNTKTVQQAVRRHASYARNAYRMHLRDSVFGAKKRCSLTACARQVSRKFGNGDEPAVELILRIAILRHFIRRHPELVAREADPWDPDQEGSESADGASASSDDSTGSGRARKRKKTTSTVHFWGAFMEFLEDKNRLWGKDLRSGGWATLIR
ncbi:hypothetical protein NUW54_g13277 [Trametes sanguinea]|uniref:Uncharacterized protein n=1 Tax=Trametes sanguinea TaxID=158606 RepID=A0ACC1MN27_9APHY|nr:hypothetical protein NUW54_g13277 [Trametes sanguinea]